MDAKTQGRAGRHSYSTQTDIIKLKFLFTFTFNVHIHGHIPTCMFTHHRTLRTDVICIRASDQIIEPFSDCSESTFITDTMRPIAFPTRLDQTISKTPASDLCMGLGRRSGVSVDEVW